MNRERSGAKTVVHMTSAHRADDTRIFAKECRTLSAAGYEVHLVAQGTDDALRDDVRIGASPRPPRVVASRG